MDNLKNIHIGKMIEIRIAESGIEISRICNFLKCTEEEVKIMCASKSLDTEILLRWSKLLEYDFFRIYTQHLIFYSPPEKINQGQDSSAKVKSKLPHFRKNIYTKEMIDFILERLELGEMTKAQIVERYRIPKTTMSNWINKYKKTNEY